MTREELGNLVGEFTWLFGQEFFIETPKGNFIWSDPDYQGSGQIREYKGGLGRYLKETGVPYGRDKGKHIISEYCGMFSFVE